MGQNFRLKIQLLVDSSKVLFRETMYCTAVAMFLTLFSIANCGNISALNKTRSKINDLEKRVIKLEDELRITRSAVFGYYKDVIDRIVSTNGPRYFYEWKYLGAFLSSHVTSFYDQLHQYLIVTSSHNNNMSIYSVALNDIKLLQTISIQGPESAKPVYIDNEIYIAVACSNTVGNSFLYAWKNNTLVFKQFFNVSYAKDVDFTITVQREVLLVFSSLSFNDASFNSPSLIYKWNKSKKMFHIYQKLNETSGGQKVHFFYVKQHLWLTIACQFADNEQQVYSYVYKFNGTYFNVFQPIPSNQTKDLYPIVAGHHTYLIAANFMDGMSHDTNSIVYRLDGSKFEVFKTLPTKGAQSVESFMIKNEYFIAIANSYDEAISKYKTDSIIYRFEGYNFEEFQKISTQAAVDIHAMVNIYECWLMAIVNEFGDVVLYKLGNVSPAACA